METSPRLNIPPGLGRILDYRKFSGPTRMLVLDAQYFFERSWLRAGAQLGWEVASVPSAIVGGLARADLRELFTALAEFKPDFVIAANYAGMDSEGILPRFFEDARLPCVTWFTDTPRTVMWGRERHVSAWLVAATWERAYVPHLEHVGFQHVHHMPLATDPAMFNAPPLDAHDRELAFVGNPMIARAEEAVAKFDDRLEVLRAVAAAFDAGQVTRASLSQGLEGMIAREVIDALSDWERHHLELLFLYEATQRDRIALAHALAPLGLEVRGDPEWAQVHARCGGAIGYFDDLAPFYRGTAVNVNSTSVQMPRAVNQRVFDCPAAGGFLLTDAQEDLGQFFDLDSEVATYESLDELRDKAAHYLARPAERRAITERAQRRILAEHTIAHRLQGLERFLRERFR